MTSPTTERELADLEHRRLRALVQVNMVEADALHADEFRLVHPSGGVWTKERYLGGIASGTINYRRFEPVSNIEVVADSRLAVLRYRSAIEIGIDGAEPGALQCWHLDCYHRDAGDGSWRVRWSQATSIT